MANAEYYLNHIAAYEREFKTWEGRAKKIQDRYRDDKRDRSRAGQAGFNVLWSNVQTLKSATFARVPLPDVSRRFRDQDPVGRVAGMILERCLDFEVQHYRDFKASIEQCVYDRFLGGRGTAWVRYEPTFKQVQIPGAMDGLGLTEDTHTNTETAEVLDFEAAPVDYVHWRDFGHSVARTWEETTIVWRKVYMSEAALARRWPEEKYPGLAKQIPLDASPEEAKSGGKQTADNTLVAKQALIYELWDKEAGQAIWLSKSLGKIIEAVDDPLGLEEFYPCPPPIYATLTTDTLVPVPDFVIYQDQADELNILADRIDGLVKALKVRGVYNAEHAVLARLFTEGENNTLIPVKDWASFAEKQGLRGAIDLVEILPIAQALAEAYKAFEQVKSQIYELTGISDILRGQTRASETATAQQIKNSYASLRLKVYQGEVERFCSRLMQLKAQIICSKFDAETILKMSAADCLSEADKQLIPQAIALLKDKVLRNFRVEVSTDSMVYQDEQQEKQDLMEFLAATSGFIEKVVQASDMAPELVPLGVEMLKFGVTGFRVGKNLEGVIDQAGEQIKQRVAQQAGQPKPDPEAAKAQAQQQMHQQQVQADQASDQARAQADLAIANAKASADAQRDAQQQAHERQMAVIQQQAEAQQRAADQRHAEQMAAQQQQHEASLAAMQQHMQSQQQAFTQQLQVMLQQLKGANAIEVAEIGAQTTLDAAQIGAAKQASTAE